MHRPHLNLHAPILPIPVRLQHSLVSDPPLKQVVAHTIEAGVPCAHDFGAGVGPVGWKLGAFRTDNYRRYPEHSPARFCRDLAFSEYRLDPPSGHRGPRSIWKSSKYQLYASATYVDARFRDTFSIAHRARDRAPAIEYAESGRRRSAPRKARTVLRSSVQSAVTG